jgi:CheY-like chemotaxis protein
LWNERNLILFSHAKEVKMGREIFSTILIVDDEHYIRMLASFVLRGEGFHVLEASGTAEALELAAKHDIDVLLTDLHMPGSLDGLQLAAMIRATCPLVHVIISSGDDPSVIEDDAMGAVFLAKPYRPHQLASAVRSTTIG